MNALPQILNEENYRQGFLMDDEILAGVSEHESRFLAFVLRHSTGEYLRYQYFNHLGPALEAINQVDRPLAFQGLGCGQGKCQDGQCSAAQGGSCAMKQSSSAKQCCN